MSPSGMAFFGAIGTFAAIGLFAALGKAVEWLLS